LDSFKDFLHLFRGRERWLLVGALMSCLIASVFEMVGITSIFPFMSLILGPTAVDRYPSLRTVTPALGATTHGQELALLGIGLTLLFLLGNSVGALTTIESSP
jgi:hypothetical protein